MSMFIFFIVLLAIIGYQILSARREYDRQQQRQAEQNKIQADKSDQPKVKNKDVAHYAIIPGESLAPQLQPKHTNQPKLIKQL